MGLTTFATGLSGLNSNSQGLNVVGNNLANLNTTGYKASNISFSEVLGQVFSTPGTAQSGNLTHLGLGSQVAGIRAVFSQGGIQTSSNPLDVAIQGKGFLVVKDGGNQYFTRAGNMHLDADGNLVAENGFNMQGYRRNATTGAVDPNLGLGDIAVPNGLMPPKSTSEFEVGMNLDAAADDGAKFTSTVQIFDTQGKAHLATLSFQKEIGATDAKWRFDVTIPNNEVAGVASTDTQRYSLLTGAVATTPPAAGAFVFDSTGALTSAYVGADPTVYPALADISIPPSGGSMPALANGASLDPTVWKLTSATGKVDITAYASPNEVTSSSQNGAAAGSLTSLAIQPDGTLVGVFSNGKTLNIAQLALAQVSNLDGLVSHGQGLFTESRASGASHIGVPGEGGRGRLMSGALEQSNVDLASELTKIITFQRGYQANARIITTTDQILQETMNLLR